MRESDAAGIFYGRAKLHVFCLLIDGEDSLFPRCSIGRKSFGVRYLDGFFFPRTRQRETK
jgi:hypothetical protein